jgi:hypothetical protein
MIEVLGFDSRRGLGIFLFTSASRLTWIELVQDRVELWTLVFVMRNLPASIISYQRVRRSVHQ